MRWSRLFRTVRDDGRARAFPKDRVPPSGVEKRSAASVSVSDFMRFPRTLPRTLSPTRRTRRDFPDTPSHFSLHRQGQHGNRLPRHRATIHPACRAQIQTVRGPMFTRTLAAGRGPRRGSRDPSSPDRSRSCRSRGRHRRPTCSRSRNLSGRGDASPSPSTPRGRKRFRSRRMPRSLRPGLSRRSPRVA